MRHFSFSKGISSESESRLIFQNTPQPQQDIFTNLRPEMTGNIQEFQELIGKSPDAQPVFDALNDDPNPSIESLISYIDRRVADGTKPLNSFETDLQARLERWKNAPDGREKMFEEKALNNLLIYITKYNLAISTSQRRRADLRQKEQLPMGINAVTGAVKTTLSAHYEGFKNANGQDRALMLAGVVVSVIVLKKIWDKLMSQNSGFGLTVKSVVGIGLGGGALYLAYEAANRNAKLATGRNILHNPLVGQDERNSYEYEQELNRIATDLRKQGMPTAFQDQMLNLYGREDKKFIAGVATLSSLKVEEAQELYEKYKDIRQIPDEGWPWSPVMDRQKDPKKKLSATERFALLEEMGKTMGLVQHETFSLPEDEGRRDKTLLYLITTGINK